MCVTEIVITKLPIQKEYIVPCENMLTLEVTKVEKKHRYRPVYRYKTEKERQEAIRASKSKYMKNKEWICSLCNNNHNYTLAGKWTHLATKRHIKNKNNNNKSYNILV